MAAPPPGVYVQPPSLESDTAGTLPPRWPLACGRGAPVPGGVRRTLTAVWLAVPNRSTSCRRHHIVGVRMNSRSLARSSGWLCSAAATPQLAPVSSARCRACPALTQSIGRSPAVVRMHTRPADRGARGAGLGDTPSVALGEVPAGKVRQGELRPPLSPADPSGGHRTGAKVRGRHDLCPRSAGSEDPDHTRYDGDLLAAGRVSRHLGPPVVTFGPAGLWVRHSTMDVTTSRS